jgi:FixJ family two-component response regulator
VSKQRPVIFLVEDDHDVVGVLIEILQDKYDVSGFHSSHELFSKLDSGLSPDMFLLDINLPFRSGIHILETLREKGYNQPAIFVSGYGNRGELVKSMNLGALAFIDKPINFKDLNLAIERLTMQTALKANQTAQLAAYRDQPIPRSAMLKDLEAEEDRLLKNLDRYPVLGLSQPLDRNRGT